MDAIVWTPRNRGTVTAAPTSANPERVQLATTQQSWGRFHAENQSGATELSLHVQSTGDFRLSIEVETNRGARRFAFLSNGLRGFRLGRYYFKGLGSDVDQGRAVDLTLDLQQIAADIEPGTQVLSAQRIYIGVSSAVVIELLDRQMVPPPPDPPGPVGPEQEPPTAEPPNPATDPGGPQNRTDAVRFLTQATFGPSPASINELMQLGSYNGWIDRQFATPISLSEPGVVASGNGSLSSTRHYVWWENVMRGPDQLRQRLAFAWSQIFVVSDRDYELSNSQYSITNFYDMLAAESFGNFRTMLERVTLHPVMGVYLSMVRNQRANPALNIRPDENFAREVLQLFTIGLHELEADGSVRMRNGQPIPAYDQRTVEEFAKLFTGWNYADSRWWDDSNFRDKRLPMTPWEDYHEPEAKDLLNGVRVAAGGGARSDMTAALDNIFDHPNVGPFLARQLIQRLVTSNPTAAYVGRVAAVFNNDGAGVRGNLAAVSRAVLIDPEARTGHTTLPRRFGKIKEPIMRLTNLWRAFEAVPGAGAAHGEYKTYAKTVDQIESLFGQAPMRASSVFNFYSPKAAIAPGSDLVAPELSILTEINVASTNNMLFSQIQRFNAYSSDRDNVALIDIDPVLAMANNPAQQVDHLAELLLTAPLPGAYRQAVITQLGAHGTDAEGLLARTVDAIYAIVGSPFHLVQK